MAGPTGEVVIVGQATFERLADTTTITAAHNTIIRYNRFDIGVNESVVFVQPSASSRVLNRIESGLPTEILGTLRANGIVYLVNPAGMLFGPNAFVDAGGIYAAAGTISNPDFLDGANRFSGLTNSVTNAGRIRSSSVLALIGNQVANRGQLVAEGGVVALLSGREVLVGEAGASVFVNLGDATQAGIGVENTGSISTGESGSTVLAAGDVYSLAIRQSGSIRSGVTTLHGGAARTENAGSIDASRASGPSGTIGVRGGEVVLGSTQLDVSASLTGDVTVQAENGITIAGMVTVPGASFNADRDNNGTGTLTVEGGATLRVGSNLEVIAADMVLGAGGTIDTRNGVISLTASAGRAIALGTAAGDFALEGVELAGITAKALNVTTAGNIRIAGLTAEQTARIDETRLESTTGNIVINAASVFARNLQLNTPAPTARTILEGDLRSGSGSITARGLIEINAPRVQLQGNGLTLLAITGTEANTLTLDAGAGALSGSSVNGLGRLNLGGTGGITFSWSVNATTTDLTQHGRGEVGFSGGLTTTTLSTGAGAFTLRQLGGRIETATVYSNSGDLDLSGVTFAHGATATAPGQVLVRGRLEATAPSAGFTFGTVALVADTVVKTNDGPIVFGALTGHNAGLTLSRGSGITRLGGNVTGLNYLLAESGVSVGNISVSTHGNQTYAAESALTLTGSPTLASTGGGTVHLAGAVNGAHTLTLEGNTHVTGTVGGVSPLRALTVNGASRLSSRISTTGDQLYNGTVTLAGATAVESTAGSVVFREPVRGPHALNMTANRGITLGSDVESLGSLTANGAIVIAGAAITTVGDQLYNGAVTVGGDARIESSAGRVTFTRPIDGNSAGADTLSVNSGQGATFHGSVGLGLPLKSFTASGPFAVADITVRANDAIDFSGVSEGSAVNRANDGLRLQANEVTLGGKWTLKTLTTQGSGTLRLNDATVTTPDIGGPQTYGHAVALRGEVTLTGSSVRMEKDVTGGPGASLTISAPQAQLAAVTTDNGFQRYNVPALALLGGVYTTAGGSFTIEGGGMTTHVEPGGSSLTIDTGSGALRLGQRTLVNGGDFSLISTGQVSVHEIVGSNALTINAGSLELTGSRYLAAAITNNSGGVEVQGPSVLFGTALGYFNGTSHERIHRGRIDATRVVAGLGALDLGPFSTSETYANAFDPRFIDTTSVAEVSTFLASGVPTQSVAVVPEAAISQALREQMVQLGIYARPRTEEEIRSALLGVSVYEQVVPPGAPANHYEVADSRLSASAVKAALSTYQALFNPPARASEIQDAMRESFRGYLAQGIAGDAAGFRAYLDSARDERTAAARMAVQQMGTLFSQIERLGLTSKEIDISKSVLVRPWLIPGLSGSTLRRVIEERAIMTSAARNPAAAGAATTSNDSI